jgi:hypothetical protein
VLFSSLQLSEVTVDVEGSHARALFKVEGQGRVGGIHVGYIGGEAVGLKHANGRWEVDQGVWLPRLAGVLEVLRRRDEAIEHGDGASLGALAMDAGQVAAALPKPEVLPAVRAWLVRVEGEGAVVSEVSQGAGDAGTPPTTHRLELHRQGNGWRFTSGLL